MCGYSSGPGFDAHGHPTPLTKSALSRGASARLCTRTFSQGTNGLCCLRRIVSELGPVFRSIGHSVPYFHCSSTMLEPGAVDSRQLGAHCSPNRLALQSGVPEGGF